MRASLRQSLSAVLRMRLLNNVRFTISVNEYSSGTMANCQAKVKAFYGDNSKCIYKDWERKRIKLEKVATEFRRHPIIPRRKLRIDDPLPVFETFPRQQMAFDYVRTCHQDVHVFAREKDNHGKRIYIVATLPEFWYRYTRERPEDKNYYEVIPEGAACRLYFDLEFKTELNPEKNGSKMVDTFIEYVCLQLKDMYDLNCDRRTVIDLDSSTNSKFSRHLIFHLPGAVFKDNIHAGNFVRHSCSQLETKLGDKYDVCNEHPGEKDTAVQTEKELTCEVKSIFSSVFLEKLRELMIKDGKPGGFGIFCDQGVYTKNRNFRILNSTKVGKNSPLLVSSENAFKPSFKDRKGSFSKDHEYLLFLDSLVSNVSMQTGGKDVKVLTCDSCVKSPKKSSQKEARDASSSPSQSGYEHSPYPDIDLFVSSIINKGGVQGEIRRWVFFPQALQLLGKLLTYDILKNRWCENIGRPHKSNHIMIVVDLRHGVYYQKCHDPDCKHTDYRSPERPIPDEINPLSRTQYEEFFGSEDDDEELFNAAADFEKKECDDMSRSLSSYPKYGALLANSYKREEQNPSEISDLINWGDESEDDIALLQVDVPEAACHSTESIVSRAQDTINVLSDGTGNKFFKKREGPTSDCPKSTDTTRSQNVGGHPGRSGVSVDSNLLNFTSDKDVCNWLNEDPVSDLELSFAAEDVESTTDTLN